MELDTNQRLVLDSWLAGQRDYALDKLATGEWVACAVCLQVHSSVFDWGMCQED